MVARLITLAALLLLCVGGFVARLPSLDARTIHGDEANQMIRFKILWEEGKYEYDPIDNHGPTLYYLTLPVMWLAGVKDFVATTPWHFRILTVVFGALTLLWYFGLRDGIGSVATLFAALLCAIAPAMIFYSRYYIQEPLLVFFTFGTIVAGWRYTQAKTRRSAIGWMIVAGLCVGLMHATKETWVIAGAAMGGGAVMTALWTRWFDGRRTAIRPLIRPWPIALGAVACIAIATVFYTSFFTDSRGPLQSILAYKNYIAKGTDGTHDHPFAWYLQMLWATRSKTMQYAKADPVHTEAVILILAAIGVLAALWPRRINPKSKIQNPKSESGSLPDGRGSDQSAVRNPQSLSLRRFLAFYTLLTTLGYAIIRYKTPWCMMTFLQGMTLMAGIGAAALIRLAPHWSLRPVVAMAILAPILYVPIRDGKRNPRPARPLVQAITGNQSLLAQSYRLNYEFPYYNDERRNPYLYSHTTTDMLGLVKRIEQLAAVHPAGRHMIIKFLTDDYWPMPYYLRAFTRVGYYGGIPADAEAPWLREPMPYRPVIITSAEADVVAQAPWKFAGPGLTALHDLLQAAGRWCPALEQPRMMLERRVRARYRMEAYSLRWGTLVAVWIDSDLWKRMLEAQSKTRRR